MISNCLEDIYFHIRYFSNFHNHVGYTLCEPCLTNIVRQGNATCPMCRSMLLIKCSNCEIHFPGKELFLRFHGHNSHYCIACIVSQKMTKIGDNHFLRCDEHPSTCYISTHGQEFTDQNAVLFRRVNRFMFVLDEFVRTLREQGWDFTLRRVMDAIRMFYE